MSTREPMWYCYECRSEMRPLMVPDPHCASCNGTFVEKMENPADDPRNFRTDLPEDDDPFSPSDFLLGISNLLNASSMPPRNTTGLSASTGQGFTGRGQTVGGNPANTTSSHSSTSGFSIRIDRSGTRATIRGGAPPSDNNGGNGQARIPLLSEFVQRAPGRGLGDDRDMITGPLMFQYLITLLSQGRNGTNPDFLFPGMMGGAGGENGRWGDYVFNQEALDQIISQLMENSHSHPVPATEEVMRNLPKDVLTEGSPLLEKDCAVCKDQFQLNTEDPAEQVVVTLPCKHPFHEPCIMPWLKSSGTCPVCRHELVPQPHHGVTDNTPGGSGSNNRPGNSSGNNQNARGNDTGQGGIFSSLFNLLGTHNQSNQDQTNNGSHQEHSSNGSSSSPRHDIPGAWDTELD